MKILKNIIIALAVIVVLAAIGIYFMPKEFTVTNSIEINKPVDVVYAQLSDFNKWAFWDPWKEQEPTAKTTVEGPVGMKGHKMSWEGQKIGSGCMTLDWSKANESIHSEIDFAKPFTGHWNDIWALESDGGKTKVTWTNSGGLAYPLGRISGSMVKKMTNKEQQKGLDNLKKYCEALPAPQPMASADSTSTSQKPM